MRNVLCAIRRPAIQWRLALFTAPLVLLPVELAMATNLPDSAWYREFATADLGGYLEGARRFLATGSPYLPPQIAGPWTLGAHSFIHPPTALPLFLAFLVLPWPLWWAIPLALTIAVVWQLRPAPWSWPLLAACVLWPRSLGSLAAGNSDMWAMALVAVAVRWGPGPLLAALKPTFAPLALVGIRTRAWWIAALACAALGLLTLPLWFEYLAVVRNAGLPLTYSLLNVPLLAIPLVAWAGRQVPARYSAATCEGVSAEFQMAISPSVPLK